ncbi:MAG: tetratricopeptide repeat protein [Verrucomicrobiia bacterium]
MKSPDKTEAVPQNNRNAWWMALCLAVVTLAIFWPATRCEFVNYDDNDYVTSNSHVQKGLTTENVRWAFTVYYENLRIPLTWLSHIVDWHLYRSNPWGHHLTSILLHTANTVLLFLLLRCMTGSLWRSAWVAALFALHPLHVETAAWVSERKGVLSTFFWLLTLWSYARYAQFNAQGLRIQAGSGYALALLFFTCSLLTKPIVVTLPFVLLLLDYWPLERWKPGHTPQRWRELIVEKIPFFLLAGIVSLVTFCKAPDGVLSAGQRISNALISYPRYLAKMLWPLDLAVPYPHPWHWPLWEALLAAAFLAAVTRWVIQQAPRRPYVAMGWFWFLGTLVPVLGLVRMSGHYSIADRYTYVPLIGIFVAAAWAAGEAASRSRPWRTAVSVLAVLLLCSCAWRTVHQLGFWRDSGTLFTHALQVTDKNFVAHTNLGFHLENSGRLDEAIKHYMAAVRICPQYGTAWNNLFNAQTAKDRLKKIDDKRKE